MAQHSDVTHKPRPMTVDQVAAALGVYPIEAYEFVRNGLHFTIARIHGAQKQQPQQTRHISGQQLSNGLRAFAHMHWGMMARAVLARWNVTTTYDFGRIVFAMVDAGLLQKTDGDSIEDFRGVYDFVDFDLPYRIESKL